MVDADRVALAADELRAVAAFALASAEEVLDIFEGVAPDGRRARAAVEAARDVADRTVRADADAGAATPLAREAAAHRPRRTASNPGPA